ncbi:EAL domain-containing protein [Massilia sp. GCM10020059]|uniref:EAL domain-containing protein n=1 Tax=Massilia agrisoli TaxID=2892444 RepID=A0ABS8IPA4_9BURK|nr:EAL domain-containing protein [Massilia agrisoli]MCC6069583.1 EAL domain-containing protein [Massilia agrisoli]
MNAAAGARLLLEQQLRRALDNNEFELHYQPKINVASGAVVAMEALVRWRSPERGLVSPNDFISVTEEIGLIVPLGCRPCESGAVKRYHRQIRRSRAGGNPLGPDLVVPVF